MPYLDLGIESQLPSKEGTSWAGCPRNCIQTHSEEIL
jgi:hypothetical protein